MEAEPAVEAEASGADVPKVEQEASRGKPSRRNRLWTLAAALSLTVGALSLLVGWAIAEHDDRLAEAALADESGLAKQAIFPAATAGYDIFRAPAIIQTPEGHIIALAEARRGDNDWLDVDIVSRRSEDHGETWSEIETIFADDEAALGSPTPVVDKVTKTIWLAFRRSLPEEPHATTLLLAESTDDGRTWSEPMDMTDRAGYPGDLERDEDMLPGPGHGIQLQVGAHAGRLLIPTTAGRDTKLSLRQKKVFQSQVLMSDDHGHSWRYGRGTDYGSENTIAEWADGTVYMYVRNRGWPEERGLKRITVSHDGGETWEPTELVETTLKEPVCHAKLLYHPAGGPAGEPAFLFVQPDVDAKGRWDKSARRKLTMFVSTDAGETWPVSRVVHEGGASYSDMELVDEHTLFVVFEVGVDEDKTWGGQVLAAKVPLSWVLEGTGYQPPEPFSEDVFDVYTSVRAPIEEWWKE